MKITTIKTRLVVTIMVTTLLSLCVACLVYSLYDLAQYRTAKKNELRQLVQLVSPLLLEELSSPNECTGLWQKLVAQNKSVQHIVLYRSDFTPSNEYVAATGRNTPLSLGQETRIDFEGEYCQYYAPLIYNDTIAGYVAVDYALFDRISGFRATLLVFFGAFLFSSIIAFLTSSLLQSRLNRSIHSLVDVAKSIYRDKNYNARAIKHSDDEFGLLTDTINEMLDEICRREGEMQNLNDLLESRVETRTAALQEINSRLLNEKTRADQASSVKSDFLANMSHELRTPMNGIVASCDLAVAEELSPKVANYLKIIQSSSHTLLLIINDILDFSKLEAGTLELEPAPFSLAELMCKLGGESRERARRQNLKLSLNVDSNTPDILVGDRGRFYQILSNLLDNGLKFTKKGAVSLDIVCLEKKDDQVVIECSVCDTGVGLSEDGLKAIFQSFHQIDSSSTRTFGGAGLGLAITKKLAIMMGGTIEVTSHLGVGSSFIVTVRFGWKHSPLSLVAKTPDLQEIPLGNVKDLVGKHVLLAEDNEINRGIAEAMLTGLGLTMDSVENGEMALQALMQCDYDFVILDIHMPVLDGYETIKRIRAQEMYEGLAIVALSTHSLPADQKKYLSAGADACLSKPLSQDHVRDVLCSLCDKNEPATQLKSVQPSLERAVILDVHGAAKKLGIDLAVYFKVLTTFYFDYEHVGTAFKDAIARADLDWLKKKIHSLKGSASTIGADKLTMIATTLDGVCKKGQLLDVAQVDVLLSELDQVRAEAHEFVSEEDVVGQQDKELKVVDDTGLVVCLHALAKGLDESLYDQINKEIKSLEKNISGSKVVNLGKLIRMYAYDDALILVHEIGAELGFSFESDDVG